ncbi:major facilitator superfamily domain-containing protein, partial [Mycena albidolilacea]
MGGKDQIVYYPKPDDGVHSKSGPCVVSQYNLSWRPFKLPGVREKLDCQRLSWSLAFIPSIKNKKIAIDESQELAIEIVDATEKYTQEDFDRVLRKQDIILMPLMVCSLLWKTLELTVLVGQWIAYGIQQVDKTGLSTQATFGIIADTHMKGNDYAWLSTIFFIFYLLGEYPGNWIMQKFSVGKTLALAMFCWGTIVFCTAAAQNWRDLMVMRALQGVAESTAGPALLLITGMSYRTEEHSLRVLIWGKAGYGLSIIVNLINYGIGRAAQAEPGGVAAWKGMSLFLGATSVLVSILCFFFLGTPREVFWLSPEEKKIQAARVALNNTGSDAQKRAQPVRFVAPSFGACSAQMLRVGRRRASFLSFCSSLCAYHASTPDTYRLRPQYCFRNAVGAQVFQAKWAPRYRPSTVILSIMFAIEFILMALWRIYYVTINHRRAARLNARGVSHEERIRLGSLKGETDVTDLHNEYFVYDY